MHLRPSNPAVTVEPGADPNVTEATQGGPLVGRSLGEIRRAIARLAPLMVPVLVHGEPGTGKTLVAGELHRRSGRTSLVCWLSAKALDAHRAFWLWLIEVARLPETTLVLEDIECLSPDLHDPLRELVLAHPSLRLVTTTNHGPLKCSLPTLVRSWRVCLPGWRRSPCRRSSTEARAMCSSWPEHFRMQARGTSVLASDFAPDAVYALKDLSMAGQRAGAATVHLPRSGRVL